MPPSLFLFLPPLYLSSGIPESNAVALSVNHDVAAVVVEDGGHILARKAVGVVGDEETTLSHGSVADYDQLDGAYVCHGHSAREKMARHQTNQPISVSLHTKQWPSNGQLWLRSLKTLTK